MAFVLLLTAVAVAAPHGTWLGAPDPARVLAQADSDPPAFEEVAIRRAEAGGPQHLRPLPGGRLEIRGLTLADLIRFAYGASTYRSPAQIVGGPDWLHTQPFDIDISGAGDALRTDPGSIGPPQRVLAMMRALLRSYFELQARPASREEDVLALVQTMPGTLGPQLKPRADCRPQGPGDTADPERTCGVVTASAGRLSGRALPMDQLATVIGTSPAVGRVVRNETGLEGMYDLDLTWESDAAANVSHLRAALEQQLGLTLQPRRAAVDLIIVERAVMPSR